MAAVVKKLSNALNKPESGAIKNAPKHNQSSGVTLPLTAEAVASAFSSNFTTETDGGRYHMYNRFMNMDPELNNAIWRLALLTQCSYKGVMLTADETPNGTDEDMLKRANRFAEAFDFRSMFFTYSKHLLRDGDSVFVAAMDKGIGVQQIQNLPMALTTCIENQSQINDSTAIVQQKNIYVVNEQQKELRKMTLFPVNDLKKPVFHIDLDGAAEEVYDNINRYTFGVWSTPPIACLSTQILWKQAIKLVDILWRYRNVPREAHHLDTSMFTPDKFSGKNYEEQITNANIAAKKYLLDYATEISGKKVDQGYVVGSNVTSIDYVQPGGKSSSPQATASNELLEQLNKSIREGLGAYTVGEGTYATELVTASYVILMPDWMSYKIKRQLTRLMQQHLILKYGYDPEVVEKLQIKLNITLDILKGEIARQVSLYAAANTKTRNELRELSGDPPLTAAQKRELERRERSGVRSASSTASQAAAAEQSDNANQEPITPHSKEKSRQTSKRYGNSTK